MFIICTRYNKSCHNTINFSKVAHHDHPVACCFKNYILIARLMGPTWGPSWAGRTQVGPMSVRELCYLGNHCNIICIVSCNVWSCCTKYMAYIIFHQCGLESFLIQSGAIVMQSNMTWFFNTAVQWLMLNIKHVQTLNLLGTPLYIMYRTQPHYFIVKELVELYSAISKIYWVVYDMLYLFITRTIYVSYWHSLNHPTHLQQKKTWWTG